MTAIRVVLLTEIPAPFRIPLFNALAEERDIDLAVVFLSERDPRRDYPLFREEWRFRSEVLPGWSLIRGGRWLMVSWGVGRVLRRLRPDVLIVGGWNQPAFLLSLVHARIRGIPTATWVESTARDVRSRSPLARLPKRLARAASSAFLVPGRAAADYVRSLGVDPERIFVAPNAVDLEIFGRRVAEAGRERDELRRRLDLGRCTFLYVGRLHREKGVDVLVRAMESVPADLVIAGAGAEEPSLRRLAEPSKVRFLGHLDRDALVQWYAAADAFVLPSRSETWGMVLNEAAASGLPLVTTEAVGAAHDLVEPGVTGYRVPVGDEDALAAALRRVAADSDWRTIAGARSRELGGRLTPDAWARAVARLVREKLR